MPDAQRPRRGDMVHRQLDAYKVERDTRRREMQKALVLYHLPESRKLVLEALEMCGRPELEKTLLPPRKRRPVRRLGRR